MNQLLELWHGNIEALGANPVALYIGIALLMFANSSIMVPPSEYICITVGVLAANEKLDLAPAILIATMANMIGTLPWYLLGKSHKLKSMTLARDGSVGSGWWERVIHAYTGRLGRIEELFIQHGTLVVIMLRNVPVLRSIASYPAGRAGMLFWRFVGASLLGISIWVALWSCLGFLLGALAHLYKWYLASAVGILSLLILKFLLNALSSNALRGNGKVV